MNGFVCIISIRSSLAASMWPHAPRCCSLGIEIAENTIHARLRERHIVLERVVDPDRMIVDEYLKILADDERVE